MNIFQALREDHEIQRTLADKLIRTSGDTDERARLYHQLKHELEIHADAEERFFYNPLIEHDLTQEKARHSIHEHHEIDDCIKKLDDTEMSSSAWLTHAKTLHHEVFHHLDEEEHEIFQLAGKALTESEKEKLATDYLKYIEEHRDVELMTA